MYRPHSMHGPRCSLTLHSAETLGPPLLLLHGVLRAWDDFLCVCPLLETQWSVHGLDLRSHGASGHAGGLYQVRDYVEDAASVVIEHFDEPVVLVGHSLGALVAAAVAAQVPRKVRAVVLEDPPFTQLGTDIQKTSHHALFAGIQGLLPSSGSIENLAVQLAALEVPLPATGETRPLGDLRDAASLRYSARCLQRMDPAVLEPLVAGRWMEGYDFRGTVKAISCPALLLQGETSLGGMLDDHDAQVATDLMTRETHIKLEGVGHLIHQMRTEDYLRLVLSFLASLD